MPSPFSPFQNAILTFQVPTNIVTTNAVGNRVVQTTPVEILAMLKPVKNAAEVQRYLGDDSSAELMKGYLIEPLQLPANLHPPVEGTATIITALGITETGTFELQPLSQSPYLTGVKVDFLNKVVGIFRRG